MKRKKNEEAVEFKSVYDVLGIEENKEYSEEPYTEESLIESIKVYDYLLSAVNKRLDEVVRDYEKNPSDRTTIETAYEVKIYILAGMAKVFGPLTAYGRNRLKEVRKASKEYESFVAPLVTRITAGNVASFSGVLPEDMKEDIEIGKVSALGAVRSSDGEYLGVGAIVFKVEYSPVIDGNIGRILWLYVDEDYRRQGVGNQLMAELLSGMVDRNVEHITINGLTYGDKDRDRLNAYMMSSWAFDLEESIIPDCTIKLGEFKNISKLKELTKGVNSLASLKDGASANGVKNALRRFGRPKHLSNKTLDSGYIDPEFSYYLGTETTISALLLSHRLPSGKIRVEYMNTDTASFADQKKLLSSLLKDASMKCSDDTVLYIPVDSEEIALFLDDICPVQLGQYMLEGLLAPMSDYDDEIDVRTVKDLLK